MASYSLVFKRSVAKDLRSLSKTDVARILKRFDEISQAPRGPSAEKLSAQERYRVRQGDYRILYEIRETLKVVAILKIGHRREVYR